MDLFLFSLRSLAIFLTMSFSFTNMKSGEYQRAWWWLAVAALVISQ